MEDGLVRQGHRKKEIKKVQGEKRTEGNISGEQKLFDGQFGMSI